MELTALRFKTNFSSRKNRKLAPNQHVCVVESCNSIILVVEAQLKSLETEIQAIIEAEP